MTAAINFLIDRMRDLKQCENQTVIVQEVGLLNTNMLNLLKSGANKIPLDRVPALAKVLEADPAYLMRLSLKQCACVTAANAVLGCLGTPITVHKVGWLVEQVKNFDFAQRRSNQIRLAWMFVADGGSHRCSPMSWAVGGRQ